MRLRSFAGALLGGSARSKPLVVLPQHFVGGVRCTDADPFRTALAIRLRMLTQPGDGAPDDEKPRLIRFHAQTSELNARGCA